MEFAVFPWRFTFSAREPIFFPPGKAANVLRGGFGLAFRDVACDSQCLGARQCHRRHVCSYARIFEPAADSTGGPSGLADRPRPFVFRAAHLDGKSIAAGQSFHFDLHVFVREDPAFPVFRTVFGEVAREGFGATRGRADLCSVSQLGSGRTVQTTLTQGGSVPPPVVVPLDRASPPARRLRIRFVTPTELKAGAQLASRPEFSILFGRARDRVATLAALYGSGPLQLDFLGLGERSEAVRLTRCEIGRVEAERLSSRTGQRHSLGGFVGEADYEGDLTEFLPILKAAEWTGIGRQTVWGKGEIRCFPGVD